MNSSVLAEKNRSTSRGRVLHVITRLDRGGSSDNTIISCMRLQSLGWDVHLAYGPTEDPSPLLRILTEEGRVTCFGLPSLIRPVKPVMDMKGVAEIRKLLLGQRYGLVHTHSSKAGLLGRWAARGLAARVVHTPHGNVFQGYFSPGLSRLIVAAERRAARWCDRIVVLTGKGKRDHLDARVGRPEQFVTIPSGVSLDDYRVETEKRLAARARFGLGGDDFVVGCVARITRVKGQIHLVRAAWQLKRKIPSLRLLMVGDGEDRREIETFAGNRFLEGEAVFTGALDDPTQAFAAMDLCVMPSLDEGQGRAAIEAMAAGVPVIASDVGGLTEVLDSGKAGALVPPGDPAALADAIQSLAVDPAKRAQFAQAGRDRAELFSEDKMIRLLDSLYSELLGVPGMEN